MVSGGTYRGGFHNGVFSGKGREEYPDGSIFDGEFEDGRRCKRYYCAAIHNTTLPYVLSFIFWLLQWSNDIQNWYSVQW
jgi:hypothetical protein